MNSQPKYSQLEIERRWIFEVSAGLQLFSLRARRVEDKYLSGGRLRLRRVSEDGCPTIFKLGKKYGSASDGAEPVITIYLTETEYHALLVIPGRVASKTRYSVRGGALDVYENPHRGLAIFEMEFSSTTAAAEYVPPHFVGQEITSHRMYTGFALSEVREGDPPEITHRVTEQNSEPNVRKACPVVIRSRDSQLEILVFKHPLAGIQLIKGTIERGESSLNASERELQEEAGLTLRARHQLLEWQRQRGEPIWSICMMEMGDGLPHEWKHYCKDDGGHLFQYFWHPLRREPNRERHPVFVDALTEIRGALMQLSPPFRPVAPK